MNVKISQLPLYSATVNSDLVFVIDNSGETQTSKILLNDFAGMTSANGNNSVQSNSWLTSLGTTASTESAIAIGNGAEATSPYAIAIGYQARNDNRDGTRNNYIAIGTSARAVQESFALGTNAKALGASTCSVGEQAETYGNSSLAVGKSSRTLSTGGVTLGYDADDASNNYGTALGSFSSNQADYGIAIGYSSLVSSTANYGIAIGYESQVTTFGSVAIGYSARTGNEAVFGGVFAGSGNTNAQECGIILGGIDNQLTGGVGAKRNSLFNCRETTFNGGNRNTGIGLSGRTFGANRTGFTAVENLYVYKQIDMLETVFDGSSSTVDIDIVNTGLIELTATGGTYNINIEPTNSNIGLELTLMIHYYSAATINFVSAGNTQWRWGNGAGAPVFSGNNNYNILVFRSWDGNDMYEQSRSMWMS